MVGVRFNENAAIAAFKAELLAVMVQLQQEFLNEIQSHMRDKEHADSWYLGDVTDVAGVISAQVIGGAWAVMDNYGTGSLMDTDNPALDDYRASGLWNHLRSDTKIRGRAAGEYTNIFGEEVKSSGKRAGMIIEGAKGMFQPQPPSHAVQETAARWMANGRMQDVLKDMLRHFPWGRFIEVRR